MPLDAFSLSAADRRYDVEALAADFGTGVPEVCARLAALPPAKDVPRFGSIRANASGTILSMNALPGLTLPR